jgi:hypothetical protein
MTSRINVWSASSMLMLVLAEVSKNGTPQRCETACHSSVSTSRASLTKSILLPSKTIDT